MEVIKTDIEGVYILEPKVFGDSRGYFFESFNAAEFEAKTGVKTTFVHSTARRHSSGSSSAGYCQPRGQGERTLTKAGPGV